MEGLRRQIISACSYNRKKKLVENKRSQIVKCPKARKSKIFQNSLFRQ